MTQKFQHVVGIIFAPSLNELQRVLNENYSDCHSINLSPGYSTARSAQEVIDGTATPGYLIAATKVIEDDD